jgi:hypothetical protein
MTIDDIREINPDALFADGLEAAITQDQRRRRADEL